MEKVKLSNSQLFDITINGVNSTEESLKIAIVAPEMDLVAIENLVTTKENVKRIELLSESDEVLKIYSGYSILSSLEKKKDVVIDTTIEGEVVVSDVIYISLRKENEAEARLSALEETVDVLVMSALA